jgi:hypothetical protein
MRLCPSSKHLFRANPFINTRVTSPVRPVRPDAQKLCKSGSFAPALLSA